MGSLLSVLGRMYQGEELKRRERVRVKRGCCCGIPAQCAGKNVSRGGAEEKREGLVEKRGKSERKRREGGNEKVARGLVENAGEKGEEEEEIEGKNKG